MEWIYVYIRKGLYLMCYNEQVFVVNFRLCREEHQYLSVIHIVYLKTYLFIIDIIFVVSFALFVTLCAVVCHFITI